MPVSRLALTTFVIVSGSLAVGATGWDAARATPAPSSVPASPTALAQAPAGADLGIRWARIPAGTFQMGCVPDDGDCTPNEEPRHPVTLTRAYDLMTTAVTLGMFRAYVTATGANAVDQPAWNTDARQPVVNVTWDEAANVCGWMDGRLPTEAEWERAARGGRDGGQFPWGDARPTSAPGAVNGARFSSSSTAPVARFAANPYGLFDMAGNVWEWVADRYGPYSAAVTDPRGPVKGESRVVRGGSWYVDPSFLRVSYRSVLAPGVRSGDFGFRCARDVSP